MSLLDRFDLNSEFTQFYLWAMIILLIFVILMTWVAPRNKKMRGPVTKVDDRYTSFEGELID